MYIINRNDYSAVHVLPSYLKRKRGDVNNSKKPKKGKVVKTWDRDVWCLPADTKSVGGNISFPRGNYRGFLAGCGLIGKLRLTSEMNEEEVASEIRSIFKEPMKGDSEFRFQYLQATGGGAKFLTVPAQSSTFKWTPQQVARLSGQTGKIYILAQDKLNLKMHEVLKIYKNIVRS